MSEEMETMLRKTLDDIDRRRTRQLQWGFLAAGVACFLFFGLIAWFGYVSEDHANDLPQMLLWSVMTIVVTVISSAVALALYIRISLTNKILKAIELLSKQ